MGAEMPPLSSRGGGGRGTRIASLSTLDGGGLGGRLSSISPPRDPGPGGGGPCACFKRGELRSTHLLLPKRKPANKAANIPVPIPIHHRPRPPPTLVSEILANTIHKLSRLVPTQIVAASASSSLSGSSHSEKPASYRPRAKREGSSLAAAKSP